MDSTRSLVVYISVLGFLTGCGTNRIKAGYLKRILAAGVDVVKLVQLGQVIMCVPTVSAFLECV
jgi:hypothetical protein